MTPIIFFIFLYGVWLLLTLSLSIPNLVAAGVSSLVVTLFFSKYTAKVNIKVFQIHRYFWAFVYMFVFLWECIKANLDVAYRVLHPKLPVKPGIVRAKSSLKTDMAKIFLANSITMTPGTITVDIIDGDFFVHWIYVKTENPEEYTHRILGRFEKYLKRIFE